MAEQAEQKQILMIDDDVELTKAVTFLLKQNGYLVKSANNGTDGFKIASEGEIDLIILDIMLPDTNGFDLCEKMKEDDRTFFIPVLMLTGKSSISDRFKGYFVGAYDYITKPFDNDELLARVKKLLKEETSQESS